MIYPTEMTLTTGTTVYAGDPDSDERIQSREVRVSVTFRIDEEEEDFDLADLAYSKAAEVERARIAAHERIGGMKRVGRGPASPYTAADDAPSDSDDPPFDPSAPGLEPPEISQGDEGDGQELCVGPRYERPPCWTPPVPPARTGSVPDAETDWATRPQVLALGSHFRRLGLSPQDQTSLLRQRFGKFRLERLTKEEAAELMRSLERGEVGRGRAISPNEESGTRRFVKTPA